MKGWILAVAAMFVMAAVLVADCSAGNAGCATQAAALGCAGAGGRVGALLGVERRASRRSQRQEARASARVGYACAEELHVSYSHVQGPSKMVQGPQQAPMHQAPSK